MRAPPDLGEYLETIFGTRPTIRSVPRKDAERVPLFLRSAYRLSEATLLGRRFVLATEPEGSGGATPREYAGHVELLRSALDADVALVLARVLTHVRNRLVGQGVPFVVPGRQMFLPFLAVDFREREPRPARGRRERVSAASQALLLRHLLRRDVEGRPLRHVAAALGYSAMTLTNVGNELEAIGLCAVVRSARSRLLAFAGPRRELWERARPVLNTPVRARRWVRASAPRHAPTITAGMTALERYTAISDDRAPTFALWQNEYRRRLEHKTLLICDGEDDAEAALECWAYDPSRIAEGACVDRLSLYLSLQSSTDERVQKELKRMLQCVEW